MTGQFLITQAGIGLPAGVTADDVVLAYYDGAWQVATTGGGAIVGLVDGGAGKWIQVALSQETVLDSHAVFTINGTVFDPIPIFSSETAIDRLEFSTNGGASQVYIDDVAPTSAVPGDFDSDGDVDGADFVAWQTHFPTASGATLADGDADGDGDVDGADFVVWQTNFPFTPSSGASAVPEPNAVLLFVIGGVATIGLTCSAANRRKVCLQLLKRKIVRS